jgi:halimadienyl-diphosphate synthase
MPDWYEELEALFKNQIGKGEMAGTAYDTAWVASVPDPEHSDRPAFPQALEWLRLHQRSDGGWGAEIQYSHDRILSTLIATIVLAEYPDQWTHIEVEAGIRAIWRNVQGLAHTLHETIGFELILPTLLDRAKSLGFSLPYAYLDNYRAKRQQKISLIPAELLYSRHVTSAFSLEFLGDDVDHARLNGDLQEGNGSIATSPSATSYFITRTNNPAAWAFIADVVRRAQGAIPAVVPIDVFELAWALYNVHLVHNSFPPTAISAINKLAHMWSPKGLGHNRFYSVYDLDDTAVAYTVLAWAGQQPSADVFEHYELEEGFFCYPYERDLSVSAHIHLFQALSVSAPFPGREKMIQKALSVITRNKIAALFWIDKWHASAYYSTTHAIIALLDADPSLCEGAVTWLLQTQRPDGSWGQEIATAEETAYCVQALVVYRLHGGNVPASVFSQALEYLTKSPERKNCHYKPLWLGKTLYSPTWVVHSAVLSAMAMCEQML